MSVLYRPSGPTSTSSYKFSGLGLNIVKNLVELHGGTIVASNNLDKNGAKIEITFPKV